MNIKNFGCTVIDKNSSIDEFHGNIFQFFQRWGQRSSKRPTIEKDRGELVKSRYSRSSTGSNIIKAGTIVDPRTVVRDGEDRSIT